jgi:hypothetical protein
MPETLSRPSLLGDGTERISDAGARETIDVLNRQVELLLDHIDWTDARERERYDMTRRGPPPPSKKLVMQQRYLRPDWSQLAHPFLPTVSGVQERPPTFTIDLTVEETRFMEAVCRVLGGLPLSDLQPILDTGKSATTSGGGGAGGAGAGSMGPAAGRLTAENPVTTRQRELVLARDRQVSSRLWSFIHRTVFGRIELLDASDLLLAITEPTTPEASATIEAVRSRLKLGGRGASPLLPAPTMTVTEARDELGAALLPSSRRRAESTTATMRELRETLAERLESNEVTPVHLVFRAHNDMKRQQALLMEHEYLPPDIRASRLAELGLLQQAVAAGLVARADFPKQLKQLLDLNVHLAPPSEQAAAQPAPPGGGGGGAKKRPAPGGGGGGGSKKPRR